MIEADVEGRYSDNAFDLTAGESRFIRFTPRQPLAAGLAPSFTGYDLQSCQGNG
jgi:beta-mannosidase